MSRGSYSTLLFYVSTDENQRACNKTIFEMPPIRSDSRLPRYTGRPDMPDEDAAIRKADLGLGGIIFRAFRQRHFLSRPILHQRTAGVDEHVCVRSGLNNAGVQWDATPSCYRREDFVERRNVVTRKICRPQFERIGDDRSLTRPREIDRADAFCTSKSFWSRQSDFWAKRRSS